MILKRLAFVIIWVLLVLSLPWPWNFILLFGGLAYMVAVIAMQA